MDVVEYNLGVLAAALDVTEQTPWSVVVFQKPLGAGEEFTVEAVGKKWPSRGGRAEVVVPRGETVPYTVRAVGFEPIEGTVVAEGVNEEVLLPAFVEPNASRFTLDVLMDAAAETGKAFDSTVTISPATLGDCGYAKALLHVDTTLPGGGLLKFETSEAPAASFDNTGTWGTPGGFEVPADYTKTVVFSVTAEAAGSYIVNYKLVDEETGAVICAASGAVTVTATDVKLTVKATPGSATVKIDDVVQSSKTVKYGTTCTWSVENEGYITQSGSETLKADKQLDIALVSFAEDLSTKISKGGPVALAQDTTVSEPLEVSKDTQLSLGAHKITAVSTNAVVVNGGTLTLSAGVSGGIAGGSGGDVCAVVVNKSGTCVIESGEYTVGSDAKGEGNSTVYVVGGTLRITGGSFKSETAFQDKYWPVNVKNKSNGTVEISGGRFYKFDPSKGDNQEGGKSFVAEGYKVKKSGDWYEVVAAAEAVTVTTGEDLAYALTQGGEITTEGAVEISERLVVGVNDTKITLGGDLTNTGDRAFDITATGVELNLAGHSVLSAGEGVVAKQSATVTVKGNGTVKSATGDGSGYALCSLSGAVLTVEDGTYYAGGSGNSCVYAQGGTINIGGGSYECKGPYTDGKYYVLNVNDQELESSTISLTGGRYHKFDPAGGDNYHPEEIFVAPGYKSESEGDDWYVVVSNEN